MIRTPGSRKSQRTFAQSCRRGLPSPFGVPSEKNQDAYLWALASNHRAVAFYRKLGFGLDGVNRYDPDWRRNDLRMCRLQSRG